MKAFSLLCLVMIFAGITVNADAQSTQPSQPQFKNDLRLKLTDSSELMGNVAQETVVMKTAYGTLTIPISEIVSLRPGLNSRSAYRQKVAKLIEALGGDEFASRDEAHKALVAMGPTIKIMLQDALSSADTETAARIKAILKTFQEALEENEDLDEEERDASLEVLPFDDTIVTKKFTAVGQILTTDYQFKSKYGTLKITLSDIDQIERDRIGRSASRRNFTLEGKNMYQRGMVYSGIRVEKGDTVIIQATGKVMMPPWGSRVSSGPDGMPNYGTVNLEGINAPMGALVGKAGSGELVMVGSDLKFKAKKSGKLNFAIAMHPSYARNNNYNFSGSYKIKIIVKPASAD